MAWMSDRARSHHLERCLGGCTICPSSPERLEPAIYDEIHFSGREHHRGLRSAIGKRGSKYILLVSEQGDELVTYPVSSYLLPTTAQLSTILQGLPSLKIKLLMPSGQGAKKEPGKTDGLTVALLAERRAQQRRPLRKVQIELCRSEHGSQIALQINEVEVSDRHPGEDHLDGVWPTKIPDRCSSPRTASHSHVKEIGSTAGSFLEAQSCQAYGGVSHQYQNPDILMLASSQGLRENQMYASHSVVEDAPTVKDAPTYAVIDIPRIVITIALLFRPLDKRVYEAKVTELRPTESEIPFWLREVGIARGIWSKSCEQVPREASGPSEMRKIVVGDVSSTGAGVVKAYMFAVGEPAGLLA
ncbi:uncharacterized protein LACBIDRAFT_333237 [Laccaria bicolor S238N-H82]|uniref:Predicted protein n=1 Tax=Laccaria bicolor (strain S238N-H82 / ATCC MYA-4686) TaxID=486041 RepID=B0DVC1_LACBS|nr:uncharacterized protein LACBIDRAFT_333237 [Laccaria bicolor S238N-H82]EDR01551.1 predicted protein [Laccaria bicolor S238N-H82]|eukprot:XP_001887903.1 predicted protein [Laccaria bicolor S238N-H82]